MFKAKTGIDVRVVALGTGQALDIGAPRRRRRRVRARQGGRGEIRRRGLRRRAPRGDVQRLRHRRARRPIRRRSPAPRTSSPRCKKIADAKAPFASRGDKSGTHAAELRLWKMAGVDPASRQGHVVSRDRLGHGPDAQHRVGDERLRADRPRHLALLQEPRRPRHRSSRATSELFNQYGVMLVNPAKHPHVKKELGMTFIDWVMSPEGQTRDRRLQDRRRAALLPELQA